MELYLPTTEHPTGVTATKNLFLQAIEDLITTLTTASAKKTQKISISTETPVTFSFKVTQKVK